MSCKASCKTIFFFHNESQEITPRTFPMLQGQMSLMNEYQRWVPFTYGAGSHMYLRFVGMIIFKARKIPLS